MGKTKKRNNDPSGLEPTDTLEDALKRSDELSAPDGKSYSAMMTSRKDLRRIVLLVREYRHLKSIIGGECDRYKNSWCTPPKKDCPNFLGTESGGACEWCL